MNKRGLINWAIWIGVVSQIEQGQVMNSAILSDINTEISLLGISRADIVMRGGGAGAVSLGPAAVKQLPLGLTQRGRLLSLASNGHAGFPQVIPGHRSSSRP